jgi:hypothetical protein
MEKIILKYIDFDKCSSYLLLIGFLWIISIVLIPAKAIPQEPFRTIILIIDLYLTLYVYLGFVKFSLIEKKDFFRIIIFAVMALAVIHSLISKISFFYKFLGVPFAIDCILLYYAFKSVGNSKIIYFRKLSRLYLYLSFIVVPMSIALLFRKDAIKTIPQILVIPFIIIALGGAILIIYIWYLKIRLFKQLAIQMD